MYLTLLYYYYGGYKLAVYMYIFRLPSGVGNHTPTLSPNGLRFEILKITVIALY